MRLDLELRGINLNGSYYSLPELVYFCEIELQVETEPYWKLDVYRFIMDFLDESDTIVQQTSGTTGIQKSIELPKKSMLASAKNTIDYFGLKGKSVAVLCLPIKYIAGKMMVVRALAAGMKLKLVEPSSCPDFANIRMIDFCAMVPMQASNLLKKDSWPKINTLILGGAETGTELHEQIQSLDTQVYETYGMAETCSHVALKRLNGNQPETFFTALRGVQLSKDIRGCLVIEATYLPDKIVTNDCVEMIDEHQFKWLGRFDNVINSGGIKIQPELLEQQFQEFLRMPCAIIGKPDELLGQKMVLIIETSGAIQKEEVLSKLAACFDKKLLPKEIHFLTELPRNESFKIDRKKLI